MDRRVPSQQPPTTSNLDLDLAEEAPPEADEPPEGRDRLSSWNPVQIKSAFNKANTALLTRRESLLTQQLHSETEQTDDDEVSHAPPRALSTQSTWSNHSIASTAELTSDDGHSVASPAISPPLPPTTIRSAIPITEKPLSKEPQIMEQDGHPTETGSEKSVEAGLGRKRCISFACGNRAKKPPPQPAQPPPSAAPDSTTETSKPAPPRKCMLTFACPPRVADGKPLDKLVTGSRRAVSPPPPERKSDAAKVHRGSDSTVTHVSPRNTRKSTAPALVRTAPTPTTPTAEAFPRRKLSDDSDASTEATRFHEFASSDDEPEEWVQESTCHRSRLTVSDTLQKENILRKACEEVEEEVVEDEEDEENDEDENHDDEAEADDLFDDDEEESDEGFRTDDEDGFAESDSEGEESDEEWWRPTGLSTAATSVDHLDRLMLSKRDDVAPASSVGSASSSHLSPRSLRTKSSRKHQPHAVPIHRSDAVDLPDSTDFVCGTLDEDRPLEQAYLNHIKAKEASKHKITPQDIDPTFPTSDPEMDEEDDEDIEDPEESEKEDLVHGEWDELDGDFTARHRPSARPRTVSNTRHSPPPPTLAKRPRSPAPIALKRQGPTRSPAPPSRRNTARSPAPQKLFGHSPRRYRSPAPVERIVSPPNTRRGSPYAAGGVAVTPDVLASRPQLTHTASLPREGYLLGKLHRLRTARIDDGEGSDTVDDHARVPVAPTKRGAIDIYKGLEKKRQRRKEKLYQKAAAAKAAAKGDKPYKIKPGKGAERMREVGLELQRYHGKGELIISM